MLKVPLTGGLVELKRVIATSGKFLIETSSKLFRQLFGLYLRFIVLAVGLEATNS